MVASAWAESQDADIVALILDAKRGLDNETQGLLGQLAQNAKPKILLINKIDLAETMGVRVEDLSKDLQTLKPGLRVIPTSCKTGAGLDEVAALLLAAQEWRAHA